MTLSTRKRDRCGLASVVVMTLLFGSFAVQAEVRVERSMDGRIKLVAYGSGRSARSGPRLRQPDPDLGGLIEKYSQRRALDPLLVRAVIQAESDFDPGAHSQKGAIGLMQLMPETARELGVDDPWDPEQNISGGTGYLRRMLDRFGGDLDLALAGYNAGPSAVLKHGVVPPYPETQAYVRKVLALYRGGAAPLRSEMQRGDAVDSSEYRPFRVGRSADGTIAFVTRKQ